MSHDQIAGRLRLALERAAAEHDISPDAWQAIERRLRRHIWRRRVIAAVCAVIIGAAAVAAPVLGGPVRVRPPASDTRGQCPSSSSSAAPT